MSGYKYEFLGGAIKSDSLFAAIVGPTILFFLFGAIFFYFPACLCHGILGLGNFALTGKGINRPEPKFFSTIFKGYLTVLTLGLAGPLWGPVFKRFFGLGGRFGGSGAIGKW